MVLTSLPKLGTVVVTALIDSINPCAIGVLILLISTLVVMSHNRRKMLFIGLIYIFSVYVVYFFAGLGLTAFLHQIPLKLTEYISMGIALVVIAGGLVEIKDYFWYSLGFSLSIPISKVKAIEKYAKNTTIPGVILLGAFVSAVELPCTGGPYLAITSLLAKDFNIEAVYLLLIYNIIFVLPLLIILFAVIFGTKIQNIKRWKQENRKYMRLAAGILMVSLGILLMLIANGSINLG